MSIHEYQTPLPHDATADEQEPLRDSYERHVREVRAEVERLVSAGTFKSKNNLSPMLIIARHAYALTYDGLYVREWVKETQEEQDRAAHLDDAIEDEEKETLRKR